MKEKEKLVALSRNHLSTIKSRVDIVHSPPATDCGMQRGWLDGREPYSLLTGSSVALMQDPRLSVCSVHGPRHGY